MQQLMHLKFWEKGINLSIGLYTGKDEVGEEFNATFYELIDDMNFYADSAALFKALQNLPEPPKLKIAFFRGSNMFAFVGKCKAFKTTQGRYLTHIEQASPIEQSSRRRDPREELNIRVALYGLPEAQLNQPSYSLPGERPDFTSSTLNVSAGGLCLVSNEKLKSIYEPYFLVDFSLSSKDRFLLPAKLVRRSNCPQTVLYKYDYGLFFMFESMPEEKQRLQMAIFRAKLSSLTR